MATTAMPSVVRDQLDGSLGRLGRLASELDLDGGMEGGSRAASSSSRGVCTVGASCISQAFRATGEVGVSGAVGSLARGGVAARNGSGGIAAATLGDGAAASTSAGIGAASGARALAGGDARGGVTARISRLESSRGQSSNSNGSTSEAAPDTTVNLTLPFLCGVRTTEVSPPLAVTASRSKPLHTTNSTGLSLYRTTSTVCA
jgi:hypothetical protein